MCVNLNDEPDSFKWNLTTIGIFSVKSMYVDYMNEHRSSGKKYLLKMKVPLKIWIFTWFFIRR
jgi:hypothetical protein